MRRAYVWYGLPVAACLMLFAHACGAVPVRYTGNVKADYAPFVLPVIGDWRPSHVIRATSTCLWTDHPDLVNSRGDSLTVYCSKGTDRASAALSQSFAELYQTARAKGHECTPLTIGPYSGGMVVVPVNWKANPNPRNRKVTLVSIQVSQKNVAIVAHAVFHHPFTSRDRASLLALMHSIRVDWRGLPAAD